MDQTLQKRARSLFAWIGLGGTLWVLGRWARGRLQKTLRTQTLSLASQIRIHAPTTEVYRFLTHFHHYRRFMSYVEDVKISECGALTWQIRGPAQILLSLQTHLVELTPERAIQWETHPEESLQLTGRFDFRESESGDTLLTAKLSFSSPGGIWMETLLGTLGFSPQEAFHRDLERLREIIERENQPGYSRLPSQVA